MYTRTRIVLIATLFNLLFEFAFRGISGIFIRPGFLITLFLIYFAYFSIVEDLIRRYRITNLQFLFVATAFGLLPETFLTGVMFQPPLFGGISLYAMFFINLVWWWCTQGVLTLYLANRLVKRDWNEPLMSKGGRSLALGFLIGIPALNILTSKTINHGSPMGYAIVIVLFFALVLYLKAKLTAPQQPAYSCERSAFLDVLVAGSVVIFLYAGLVLAKNPTLDISSNALVAENAAKVTTTTTQITFVGVLLYYIVRRKQITI